MILDDVGVTKKIWSDYMLVTFWLHIMVYGYTESDVIAELRGWNAMSGDNDVVCVLWICVVVGTESYVCDQLPKLPEEPPPIGDCASPLAIIIWYRSCTDIPRAGFHYRAVQLYCCTVPVQAGDLRSGSIRT